MNKYATVYHSMLNKLAAGEAAIGGLARGVTAPPARIGSTIPKWDTPAKTQAPSLPRTRMPQQPRVGGMIGSGAGMAAQVPSTPTAAPDPSTIQGATGAARGGIANAMNRYNRTNLMMGTPVGLGAAIGDRIRRRGSVGATGAQAGAGSLSVQPQPGLAGAMSVIRQHTPEQWIQRIREAEEERARRDAALPKYL
jgi:hypothetical protein